MVDEELYDGAEHGPGGARADQILRLASYLFEEFCTIEGLAEEQQQRLSPVPFLKWFKQKALLANGEDIATYCEEAHVIGAAWDVLVSLADDPQVGALGMQPMWHQVTIRGRRDPQHVLDSAHFIMLLKWQDGRVAPLSVYVPRELVGEDAKLTDLTICAIVQHQAAQLIESIRHFSLDDMHDSRAQIADQQAFEILMGLILKVIGGAVIIDLVPGQQMTLPEGVTGLRLPPKLQERCLAVQRLLKELFQPTIPPELRPRIAAVRAKERQAAQESAGPVSGWDES